MNKSIHHHHCIHDTKHLHLDLIKRSKGCYLHNIKGQRWIDFELNQGSLILGHAHPFMTRHIKNSISKGYVYPKSMPMLNQLKKKLLVDYPQFDTVYFFNSAYALIQYLMHNSDASTPKKVLFFGSQYVTPWAHYLANLNSICIIDSNSTDHLTRLIKETKFDILCIPDIHLYPQPQEHHASFWTMIVELCKQHHIQLIIDKSITGYHYTPHLPKENADAIILGQQIGGGLPLYAFINKNSIPPLHLDTYSSLAFTAGLKMHQYIQYHQVIQSLQKQAQWFKQAAKKLHIQVDLFGTILFIHLPKQTHAYDLNTLHSFLLQHGIFTHSWHPQLYFLSIQHTQAHLMKLLKAYVCFLETISSSK